MKLEDLVTNRELSQKLKDLGVPQNSHFYWQKFIDGWHLEFQPTIWQPEFCSAPTSSELGETLPFGIWNGKDHEGYTCWNQLISEVPLDLEINAENEADAKGAMLAFLLENNYIDVSKLRSDL